MERAIDIAREQPDWHAVMKAMKRLDDEKCISLIFSEEEMAKRRAAAT